MHVVKSCFLNFYDACQEQLVLVEWLHSNLDFSFLPPPYGSGGRLTSTSSLSKNQYRKNAPFLYYLLNLNNFSILPLMLYYYATLKLEREKITINKKIYCWVMQSFDDVHLYCWTPIIFFPWNTINMFICINTYAGIFLEWRKIKILKKCTQKSIVTFHWEQKVVKMQISVKHCSYHYFIELVN